MNASAKIKEASRVKRKDLCQLKTLFYLYKKETGNF